MGEVLLRRIDFRVIHGQVASIWTALLGVDKIIVLDDKIAKNPMMQKVFTMTAPNGVDVVFYTVEEGVEAYNKDGFGEGKFIQVFKDAAVARRAYELGYKYDQLNVGGTGGSAAKKQVSRNVNLDQTDYDNLKFLHDNGVHIWMQPIPDDPATEFESIMKKGIFK